MDNSNSNDNIDLKDKLTRMVGLAIKSGQVLVGIDNIINKANIAYIVLCDCTLSINSMNKIKNKLSTHEKNCFTVVALDIISHIKGCKALAVSNKFMAKEIEKILSN